MRIEFKEGKQEELFEGYEKNEVLRSVVA